MFERYLKRERHREEEKLNYKVKKVVLPRTHAGELSVQDKITRNIRIKHLRKKTLRLILRSQYNVLVDVSENTFPFLLSLLLEEEDTLLLKATEKMAKVSEDGDVLFKYFKCYVFNDFSLAEKVLGMLLRSNPTWVYERKEDLSMLLPESGLRNRVRSMKKSVEDIKIDPGKMAWD